jgi:hypothetical protein
MPQSRDGSGHAYLEPNRAGPGTQLTWRRSGRGVPGMEVGARSPAHSESLPLPFGGVPKSDAGIEARPTVASAPCRLPEGRSAAETQGGRGRLPRPRPDEGPIGGIDRRPPTPNLEAHR